MTRLEESLPGTFINERGASPTRHFTLISIGVVALIAAAAIATAIVFQLDRTPSVQPQVQAGEIVDGWMAGVSAANRAARLEEANRLQDGWSSSLFVEAPELTDGWSSYLLTDEPPLVDGWAARYLVEDD